MSSTAAPFRLSATARANSSRSFEVPVEGLRGVAATLVALSHLFAVQAIDLAWQPGPPLRFVEAGHAAVLIFFMLSGYVIGLTNSEPFGPNRVGPYARRRAIRLLPIYVVAWAFTLWTGQKTAAGAALGNLFFLQNFDSYFGFSLEPLPHNGPLWSLHYELIYYILFLALWRYRPALKVHLPFAAAIGIAGWCLPGFPVFISGYAVGWIFWSLGWHLSQQAKFTGEPWPVASGVFLLLATHHFAAGQLLLDAFHFRAPTPPGMVNLSNLALLPACAVCLIGASGRDAPHARWIKLAAFAIPLGATSALVATGRLTENSRWVAAAAFTAIAYLMVGYRSRAWLMRFAPFGSISYGFYLVHFPLLFVVQTLPLPSGTPAAFALRAFVWLSLAIAGAWLLERQLQPRVRAWLRPAAPAQP